MVSRSFILILGALLAVASASSLKYDHKPAYSYKKPEYKKKCYIEYKKCCYKYEKCGYKYKKVKESKKVCGYKLKKVPKKICKHVIDYDYKKKDNYDAKKTGYDYKPKGYDYKPKYKKACYTKWVVKKEKVCYYQIYYKVYKYAKYCPKLKCGKLKYKGDNKKPGKKVSKKGIFVRKFKGKKDKKDEKEYGKDEKEEEEKDEKKH